MTATAGPASNESTPPATLEGLGLRDCLCLAALLDAQEHRRPLASTRRQAISVLYSLTVRGVIRVYRNREEPCPSLELQAQTTPIEGFAWCLLWTAYERDGLLEAVRDELNGWIWDAFAILERVRVWQELALSEAEAFFENQLLKHGFSGDWASDLGFAFRELGSQLSVAQWRYCTWAATRHGASVALQQRQTDRAVVREAIYAELGRRARRLAQGAWPDAAFAPGHASPPDALGLNFVQQLTHLGARFWTEVPNSDALCLPATRAQ